MACPSSWSLLFVYAFSHLCVSACRFVAFGKFRGSVFGEVRFTFLHLCDVAVFAFAVFTFCFLCCIFGFCNFQLSRLLCFCFLRSGSFVFCVVAFLRCCVLLLPVFYICCVLRFYPPRHPPATEPRALDPPHIRTYGHARHHHHPTALELDSTPHTTITQLTNTNASSHQRKKSRNGNAATQKNAGTQKGRNAITQNGNAANVETHKRKRRTTAKTKKTKIQNCGNAKCMNANASTPNCAKPPNA